jgi:UDP-N-acetylglucosamine--dolichyl-phosphate N-acetylglucosaminephosphotransferase
MEALIISMLVSFFVTFIVTPQAIRLLWCAGINGRDLNKKNKPKLPASGGICVAAGIVAGLLTYVGIQTFVYGASAVSIYLLAVISSILIVTFVGLLDDLNVKTSSVQTKDGKNIKIGLPQWLKPLMTLPAAVPLMVLNVGETTMMIPFIGEVNFGILFPLLIIPLAVVAISNLINLLGGFNGVESGMGIVYTLALGIFGILYVSKVGLNNGSIILLITTASLLAFLKFNWVPAKILPGDSLTYLLGAVVASGLIIGNMEKIGIFIMSPFILEFLLKLRSKFKASCLGILRKDGKLDPPYGKKIYSLTHLVMSIKPMTEKQITIALIIIQLIVSALAFVGICYGVL